MTFLDDELKSLEKWKRFFSRTENMENPRCRNPGLFRMGQNVTWQITYLPSWFG